MSRCVIPLVLLLIAMFQAYAEGSENVTAPVTAEGNCSTNEVYSNCGNLCEEFCTTPNIIVSPMCSIIESFSWFCIPELIGGCRCKPGFIRNDANNCISCESS
nr:chymotrypsin inhibitor-like [Megalopta genalis]